MSESGQYLVDVCGERVVSGEHLSAQGDSQ